MSHVTQLDLHITDLESLRLACRALGLEYREGQKTFRWYGAYMGDSRLPQGFSPAELGQCEHAIAVAGSPDAYEIGVLRRRDGKPGYILHYDNWAGGYGLEEAVGRDASRLKQEYAAQLSLRHLRALGLRVQRTVGPDGRIRLSEITTPRVTVEIDPAGNPTVSVEGSPGRGCKALTRDLETALGETVRSRPTREMQQQVHVQRRHLVRR